jgi:hypothetical protein
MEPFNCKFCGGSGHIDDCGWAFKFGQRVGKKTGSWWEGRVVGFYSTEQTPRGYCVQLEQINGPVQIYPESALELMEGP